MTESDEVTTHFQYLDFVQTSCLLLFCTEFKSFMRRGQTRLEKQKCSELCELREYERRLDALGAGISIDIAGQKKNAFTSHEKASNSEYSDFFPSHETINSRRCGRMPSSVKSSLAETCRGLSSQRVGAGEHPRGNPALLAGRPRQDPVLHGAATRSTKSRPDWRW